MPRFQNRNDKYFISTSYKVLFSTFSNSDNLNLISSDKLLSYVDRSTGHFIEDYKHYVFCRNPYSRLVSFFKDKFRKHPREIADYPNTPWQHCQRMYFNSIGIGEFTTHREIASILIGFSFKDFLDGLENFYRLDAHLLPQFETIFEQDRNLSKKIHIDRICKVESNVAEKKQLSELLNISFKTYHNKSNFIELDTNLLEKYSDKIEAMYSDDFEFFEYDGLLS